MILLTATAAACTEPNPYLNVCGDGVIELANGSSTPSLLPDDD